MTKNTIASFFVRMRRKLFDNRINREIFNRLMPHVQREKDYGYQFSSNEEMDVLTKKFDVQSLLDAIEQQARNMPEGYGKKFRYLMHRDLHERLKMYEQVARRRVRRACDPRFVAVHA